MKKNRIISLWKSRKHQGFTLVELIISITVLVIILVPLMNNFYRAMQMNKRAENIQIQSNLASSIMEGLKSLNMDQTIEQFTVPSVFNIITTTGATADVLVNGGSGVYTKFDPAAYNTLYGQAAYYFAIYGIQEGGSVYDTLITMKADTYAGTGILNDYPMPDAINLDETQNGLLFSSGLTSEDLDNEVLTAFQQYGTDYANSLYLQSAVYQEHLDAYNAWRNACEIAEMNGDPIPAKPPEAEINFNPAEYSLYCNIDKTQITKTMSITVNGTNLQYVISYHYKWPDGCDNLEKDIEYRISDKTYAEQLVNVYLFYKPNEFLENNIKLENNQPVNAVNFYLAKQGSAGAVSNVMITKKTYAVDNIALFTNLGSINLVDEAGFPLIDADLNDKIIKAEKKNRIYQVDIKLYKYVASATPEDKFKEELYSLQSTRED